MKVVFIGGGSHRLLPIIRAAMSHPGIFAGGEICLYDLAVNRAETMGRVLMKTPEYRELGVRITWGDDLERALAGADADHRFGRLLETDHDETFWSEDPRVRPACDDITVRILKGLAGVRREKIVTSRPHNGAVSGFKDRTILEYSQTLHKGVLKPYGRLSIPEPLHGITSALAGHQTMLADAIATEDPKILFQALYAYPVKQNTRASRGLYKDLLKVHADEIPPVFQKARDYL